MKILGNRSRVDGSNCIVWPKIEFKGSMRLRTLEYGPLLYHKELHMDFMVNYVSPFSFQDVADPNQRSKKGGGITGVKG